MSTTYLIPMESLSATPIELSFMDNSIEQHTIFLKEPNENFFFDFPKAWENSLSQLLENIYNDISRRYTFYITSFDGKKVMSYKQDITGYNFNEYLLSLLKVSKVLTLHIINDICIKKFIICLPC